MKCFNCNCENEPGAKFCEQCGSLMPHEAEQPDLFKTFNDSDYNSDYDNNGYDNNYNEYNNGYSNGYDMDYGRQEGRNSNRHDEYGGYAKRPHPRRKSYNVFLWVAVFVLLIGVGAVVILGFKYFNLKEQEMEDKSIKVESVGEQTTHKEQKEGESEAVAPVIEEAPQEEPGTQVEQGVGGQAEVPETSTQQTIPAQSEYFFPDSDTRILTMADIRGLTKEQIRYAKNEIYARRGRIFVDQNLQAYFNDKSWYIGTIAPDDFKETMFNSIEKANVDFLAANEK